MWDARRVSALAPLPRIPLWEGAAVTAIPGSRPLSLRLSVTDRCQCRCLYCMPTRGVKVVPHDQILSFEEILRFVRVLSARFAIAKVRVTGGEPLVRRGVVDLVGLLADEGIEDLALTTNGLLLADMAADLKRAGLRRVNVSLDSLDPETFRNLTRGGDLRRVLRGIDAAMRHGLTPVKTNTVVLRTHNSADVAGIARFGLDTGCHVRFLELMPIGFAKPMCPGEFVPTEEVRARLEESFTLEPLPYEAGGTSRDFVASDDDGRQATVGFISSETHPFCGGCRRIRLTSTGGLISCLAKGNGPHVRHLLRSDSPQAAQTLADLVAAELDKKARHAGFDDAVPMVRAGG